MDFDKTYFIVIIALTVLTGIMIYIEIKQKENLDKKKIKQQILDSLSPEFLASEIPEKVILHFKKSVLSHHLINEEKLLEQLENIKLVLVKYFFEAVRSNSNMVMPSRLVDELWHSFILHSEEYEQYCLEFLGKKIKHVPNENANNQLFNLTEKKQFSKITVDTYLKMGSFASILFLMDNSLANPLKDGWLYSPQELELFTEEYQASKTSSSGSSCNTISFGDSSNSDGGSCGSSCG
jgi:hypothetical protein